MARVFLMSCIIVTCLFRAGVTHGDNREADAAPAAADAAVPVEGGGRHEEVQGSGFGDRDELIIEATLAKGLSFIPAPKRVVNTAYVFQVDKVLRGRSDEKYVVIYDTGGVLRDGRTMDTVESFKLAADDRYLVFARRSDGEYWIDNVFQIDRDDQVIADASGRVVVGIAEGRVIVQPQRSRNSLRYTIPVETPPRLMEKGPATGSLPLPGQPEAVALDEAQPLGLGQIKQYLRQAAEGTLENRSIPVRRRENRNEGTSDQPSTDAADAPNELSEATPRDFRPGVPEARLSGQHITAYQSHFHFMPDDDNWNWTSHSRGAWDVLVEPKNGFRLFAYKIDSNGNPIRNRTPVADDDRFNIGVVSSAQMTAGGYDTWSSLGANGVCYRWWNSNNRIIETDILINPVIGNDEVQFRKSFTHEYGHALTLDHERRYMALMYPGTFRQPPNYASLWYTRRDDHRGVRAMLEWVNSSIASGTWNIARFTDVATWSQAHPNPGTDTNLVMTSISDRTLNPGQTATMRNVHVENRGNQPAQNTALKFYLSTNNIISSGDREIASYNWSSFTTYWTGNLNVRVPAGTPNGEYFVGWILTTDASEPSTANNTALLLNDRTSGFSEVTVRVQ